MTIHTYARIALIAGAIGAATAAQAAVSPLDAGWYQGKPAHAVMADAQSARYVDNSPLAPTYFEGKPAAKFVATAAKLSRVYVDSHNPLDPSYRAK